MTKPEATDQWSPSINYRRIQLNHRHEPIVMSSTVFFADWIDSGFDPNVVDAGTLAEAVMELAIQRTRNPVTKRARRK